MCLSNSPRMCSESGSSAGRATYVGFAGSVAAQKYARLMSMNDTCVRSSLLGSLTRAGRSLKSVAANNRTVRRLSSGGVGAKIGFSPAFRISRATRWDL